MKKIDEPMFKSNFSGETREGFQLVYKEFLRNALEEQCSPVGYALITGILIQINEARNERLRLDSNYMMKSGLTNIAKAIVFKNLAPILSTHFTLDTFTERDDSEGEMLRIYGGAQVIYLQDTKTVPIQKVTIYR